ncbi:hypothetical protein ACLQ2R_20425 [Streptosporangium sp. DT93]|uniref:hypothetical protein n=1 Tax=Streptosporangium sp. DT93 TaxID=3393428 RepID=UPI003CF845B9
MAEMITAPSVRLVTPRRARAGAPVTIPGLLLVLLVLTGCSASAIEGSYRPLFIPVKFTMNGSGEVQVSGESTLVTPVGVFSISAKHNIPNRRSDAVYVIIRDANGSGDGSVAGRDHIYEVRSGAGEFRTRVHGRASVKVVDREVLIDVTPGTVLTIEFTGSRVIVQERPADIVTRWQQYWASSLYTPMSLSTWAYDDSTMGKWFGIGFVWFLVRLVAALVLFVFDALLTVGCLLAAAAFALFGPTGQNIVYGLEILLVLAVIWWGRVIASGL